MADEEGGLHAVQRTLDDVKHLESLLRKQLDDIEASQHWSRTVRLFGPARTTSEELDRQPQAAPQTIQILCRLAHEVGITDQIEGDLRRRYENGEVEMEVFTDSLADLTVQRGKALRQMISLATHVEKQGLAQFNSLSKLVNDMAKIQFQWAALGKLTEAPEGTRAEKIRRLQEKIAPPDEDRD